MFDPQQRLFVGLQPPTCHPDKREGFGVGQARLLRLGPVGDLRAGWDGG